MYPYDLSTSLSFFAKVDHDKIKISGPINLALSRFDVKNFSKPIFLLKHAYDLVILDSLNARLAEYVLRPVFLTSVIEDIDETKKAYILQLIAQIGCYTKLNIKDYKGSFPKLSNYSNIDDKLVEQYQLFSYVKKDSVFISNANKLVTRVAGSEVVCSGPIVINEGILINNCVKLSANHKFAKEENWAKFINSNDKTFTKTAIIYVSQKNMLKNFQTAEPIRHDGVIGLKLRLLKQLGFKVATIYDRIFNGKESSVDKLNYIKEQIYKKD
uniref:Recep_L_domain domain-containing protein n=1 Tax=Rhabditophanes sp. KR3021 TaxID=114890 RepID=A0AC35U0S0_9BILA